MAKNKSFESISLPKDLVELVDKAIKETEVGYGSRAELIKEAVREKLRQLGYAYKPRPRLEHINTYENHVKILDNELGRVASVYFKVDHESYCDVCDAKGCIHLDYAWTIPDVAKVLRAHGFKSPEEKALERMIGR